MSDLINLNPSAIPIAQQLMVNTEMVSFIIKYAEKPESLRYLKYRINGPFNNCLIVLSETYFKF